jgi:hypothetical protein
MYMKKIWKTFFRQKNQLFLLLLLTIIQCKQRYIHTSLPCNITVEDLIVIIHQGREDIFLSRGSLFLLLVKIHVLISVTPCILIRFFYC